MKSRMDKLERIIRNRRNAQQVSTVPLLGLPGSKSPFWLEVIPDSDDGKRVEKQPD